MLLSCVSQTKIIICFVRSVFSFRHVEWHDAGCDQDPEAGHHVSRGLPAGGSDHEEAAARQTGASLRRGVGGAHLHRDGIHGQR